MVSGGAVEAFRGLGAWVVLGIGLAVYGHLERGRVMVTAGAGAALLGVVAIVVLDNNRQRIKHNLIPLVMRQEAALQQALQRIQS